MTRPQRPRGRIAESPDAEWGEDEEELREPTTRGTVVAIRDVDDRFVFRFEIGPAILAQLRDKLARIPVVPISEALDAKYPGFYQLFVGGEPRYIGKTARPIGQRLREHARKLRHRIGIDFGAVGCRYAFVEDPSLVDVAEGALIEYFGAQGLAEWNTSGFGSKVTGHGRGGQAASAWATEYPPDLEAWVEIEWTEVMSLANLIQQVKKGAPITLSIPRTHVAAFDAAHERPVSVESRRQHFTEWIRLVERHLADGWVIGRAAESWYVEPQSR